MSTMNYDKSFNRISGIVWTMFIIMSIIVIAGTGLIIFAGIKGCRAVEEHGLKGAVESIWNGPTNGVKQ